MWNATRILTQVAAIAVVPISAVAQNAFVDVTDSVGLGAYRASTGDAHGPGDARCASTPQRRPRQPRGNSGDAIRVGSLSFIEDTAHRLLQRPA